MSNGIVIYQGPSAIDGAPIVVIATGLAKDSRNEKTGGGLIQTWILRADISPVEATKTGADLSICGTCPHRGQMVDGVNVNRSCYVTIFQAPLVVWKTYRAGKYPVATNLQGLFAGLKVRMGAYGDPAAVPVDVWSQVLAGNSGITGYTHQWRAMGDATAAMFQSWLMASCDSAMDHAAAKANGWRTFRVRAAGEALATREIICPASKEAGHKTSCSACLACGGQSSKARVDIAIIAHGAASKVNAFARNNA